VCNQNTAHGVVSMGATQINVGFDGAAQELVAPRSENCCQSAL
jgi:hypothetical protein